MSYRLFPLAATAAVVALTAFGSVNAGGHLPYEKRQKAMKAVGASTKAIGDMLKGATEFDAAKANEAMVAMQAAVADFGDLFPEGSETAESEAGPAIWSDRAGFDAVLAKFQADIDAGIAAAPADKAAVGAAFGQIAGNCKTCHEGYRVKK